MNEVRSFKGEHYFLSNFAKSPFNFLGYKPRSVEHMFQALKTFSESDRRQILWANYPSEAKGFGHRIALRTDWDQVKDRIMYHLVLAKFTQNVDLHKRLLHTGDAVLIEGNDWGDTYWGMYAGHGQNRLGQILMRVRGELWSLG
jgi:hypothetical protein